jgi:hypothetical protein
MTGFQTKLLVCKIGAKARDLYPTLKWMDGAKNNQKDSI